jgi:hypothetical protein
VLKRRIAFETWLQQHRIITLSAGALLLVIIVVALGVAFGLAVATFVVVVYTAVFSAIVMLGWRPFVALPSLEIGLWHKGELVSSYERRPDRPRAAIDIDTCVRNALAAVQAEIPAPPSPPQLSAALQLAALSSLSNLAGTETRDQAIKRLNAELTEYEAALRQWLEDFSCRRWASYSLIRAKVAIHNGGDNVADGITLRIMLPDGIVPMIGEKLGALEMPRPPTPPRYEERSLLHFEPPLLPPFGPHLPALSTPTARAPTAAVGPTYLVEQGHAFAEVRLDTLTHGVTERSVEPLVILPSSEGLYELSWEAHVGNLRRPARGSIRIKVNPMSEGGETLSTVDAVEQSGDVPVSDAV